MNHREAKFVLGAYRPDGSDAGDPAFAEVLAAAGRDPELQAWLESQRRFDQAVAAKLQTVMPPAGLRDAILAGGRASRPRSRWWQRPVTLAAAIIVLGFLIYAVAPISGRPTAADLVSFALGELADAYDEHEGFPPLLASVQGQLANARLPLTTGLSIDLADLGRKRCRTVRVGGREVFELCFNRDGVWYHLYAARRSDFAAGAVDARALLTTKGSHVATAWADAQNLYALVAQGTPADLQRLL